jgi:hypothetical protein
MMSQFGIDHVRGGTYCQVDLDTKRLTYREFIIEQIQNSSDTCFHCDSAEHFHKECPMMFNLNKRWTLQETNELRQEVLMETISLEDIARVHRRTVNAVLAKLKSLHHKNELKSISTEWKERIERA